jgi:hypothetical protein
MKETLFTTPHNGSKKNFALDAQREMDHKVSFCPPLLPSLSVSIFLQLQHLKYKTDVPNH